MPVETGIQVQNLSLTLKALKELGADNKSLQEPGFLAAELLVRKSRSLVPVKTGALSTSMRPRRIQRGGSVQAGGRKVPYANPIHWGWLVVSSTHKGTLKPGTYRGIKPQPFFSEALGYNKQAILDTYKNAMQKLIDNLPGASK
jgi:hypothetical protein